MEDYEGWADLLPRTGNPVLDAAVIVSVGAIVVVGALVVLWVKVRPWLEEIRSDTKVVREQTENSHASSPTPNLRDDLDSKHAETRAWQTSQATAIATLSEHVRELSGVLKDTQKDIGGIREELRNDRQAARLLGEKLDAHIDEKKDYGPRIKFLEHELKDHRKAMEDPS